MATPLIVDPHDYCKQRAFEAGVALCTEFLQANGLSVPVFEVRVLRDHPQKWHRQRKLNGYYDPRTQRAVVDVKNSRVPVRIPGYSWSFTGYKADLTAPGILAHEVGHHVDHERGGSEILIVACVHEPSVSSYDENNTPGEKFAEAVKLLILNPDLLRQGRPERWAYLTETLKLVPAFCPDEHPWYEILCYAHKKLIGAAERWVSQGQK